MTFRKIEEAFEKAIAEKIFPGAALLVGKKGEVRYRGFFGSSTLIPEPEPVTEKTLFDIASLTKPVATTTLALLGKREGTLSLDKHLIDLSPQIDEDKYKMTLRHLLKHTSGLPAWRPYFEEIAREQPDQVGKRSSRDLYFQKISHEPLELPITYQRLYSDLGFILAGILLEDLYREPLDQLFQKKVAAPFELNNTFYQPLDGSPAVAPFAATEDSDWRKKVIRGEVHDDNAYTLGGVAGHAGLFSTVDDLHRFANEITYGYHGRSTLIPQETLLEFIGPKVRFKLGWDTPSAGESQAGRYFSGNSIGQLGFTGCSLWINLDEEFHIILLTNRVHPSRQNDQIKLWRPTIHDLLYEELLKTS